MYRDHKIEKKQETIGKTFPQLIAPKDTDGFIESFPPKYVDGYMKFFKEYGFVIIDDVLSPEACKQSIFDIWQLIEQVRPDIKRDNPTTWNFWLGYASAGLLSQALSEQAWKNRLNLNVYEIFSIIMRRPDLWVSVDNWGLLRPTKKIPNQALAPDPYRISVATGDSSISVEDKPDWITNSRWLHWDLNPYYWTSTNKGMDYEFSGDFISENNGSKNTGTPKLQGLVNLYDAREEDGGFLIVPGFHKHLKEWAAQPHLKQYWEDQADSLDFVYVPQNDPLQDQVQKIPMRAGSLLIWSSEMPHCNYSNSSSNFRMVQYIKMFEAQSGKPGTDLRRKLLIEHVPKHLQNDPHNSKILGIEK